MPLLLTSILALCVAKSNLPGEAKHETLGPSLSSDFLSDTHQPDVGLFLMETICPKFCSKRWVKSAKRPLLVNMHSWMLGSDLHL